MKKLRPFFSAVLGLVFLLQGVAVAAAPRAVTGADPVSSAVGFADMDCHGQPADAGADPASCCDADCPDMGTCSMSHLGVAPDATLHLPATAQGAFVAALPSTAAVVPPSLLRPPINFPV